MLVFGDHEEQVGTRQFIEQLNRDLDELVSLPPGLDRHARLVGVLIEAGRLLQGLADAAFAPEQRDRRTRATEAVTAFLSRVAGAVCRSWKSGFEDFPDVRSLQLQGAHPPVIQLKLPEGYAFYAVYPEAYAEAARRLRLNGPPRVIGIRSIGTSLAAVVAAELGAPPPVTVRPFGDPFARRIALDSALGRDLLDRAAHYVIVDEGPGLSGSSFAAVAEWLTHRGIRAENIALLPSHAGFPGGAAPPHRQEWWQVVQRQVADLSGTWIGLLRQWCKCSLGWDAAAIKDVSAGAWRPRYFGSEHDWPPVVPAWERLKFIAHAGGERFLLKFAGVGRTGEAKLQLARRLYSKRLAPEPIGLVHGFLVERWCEGALPLEANEAPVREVGRYIGERARLLEADRGSGASVHRLLEMARRNLAVEFGEEFATSSLSAWHAKSENLERRVRRIPTDNKLERWEWLRMPTGELIKTDALDHHQGHDLIGCQDVAWDAAGAIVEFGVSGSDQQVLLDEIAATLGRPVDRELLSFCLIGYSAFRLGQARLGAVLVGDLIEKARIRRASDAHAAWLRAASATLVPVGK